MGDLKVKYYKVVIDGYISVIGENICGEKITQEEYDNIMLSISNRPSDTETETYKLKDGTLEWVAFPIEQ